VSSSARFLSASEAARRLKVSVKALRLYEQRGLLAPARTSAGWRVYGPEQMARATEISAMRALGLSLAQIKQLLDVKPGEMESALAAQQTALEAQIERLEAAAQRVRDVRADLALGKAPAASDLITLVKETTMTNSSLLSFVLPWPWNGELFEFQELSPINYLVGPLGSGKTQFSRRLEAHLPGTRILTVERLENGGAEAFERLRNPALRARVKASMERIASIGGLPAEAVAWLQPSQDRSKMPSTIGSLIVLLTWLDAGEYRHLIVDLPEHGLDEALQQALIRELRERAARPAETRTILFLVTRSSGILDMAAVGPDETVFLFPANHNPPTRVAPVPGGAGYEAVAMCLAAPASRARTAETMVLRAIDVRFDPAIAGGAAN
jgi:DNA-binding transcriptional MerR regulator